MPCVICICVHKYKMIPPPTQPSFKDCCPFSLNPSPPAPSLPRRKFFLCFSQHVKLLSFQQTHFFHSFSWELRIFSAATCCFISWNWFHSQWNWFLQFFASLRNGKSDLSFLCIDRFVFWYFLMVYVSPRVKGTDWWKIKFRWITLGDTRYVFRISKFITHNIKIQ